MQGQVGYINMPGWMCNMKEKKQKAPRRVLTKEERKGYINGISEEVFQKPFDKLEPGQIATLKCNLIVRLRMDHSKTRSITEDEYSQLIEELQ